MEHWFLFTDGGGNYDFQPIVNAKRVTIVRLGDQYRITIVGTEQGRTVSEAAAMSILRRLLRYSISIGAVDTAKSPLQGSD